MSHNIVPLAKLLSRKLLPLPKPRIRVQTGRKQLHSMRHGRLEKVSPSAAWRLARCLSPGESERAEALANITDNYQRPDQCLIEAMRKKQRLQICLFEQEETPVEPPPPFPTVVAKVSIAVAQRAQITESRQSQVTVSPTPKSSKQREEWEERAKRVIEQENLSLERDWSKATWKQKASNVVRLKLLKDDGYDIAPLRVKGTSADQIIDALLAHVHTRKQPAPVLMATMPSNIDAQSEQIPGLKESEVTGTREQESLAVISSETMDIYSIYQDSKVTYPNIVWPYTTVPVIGQKRKHSHQDYEKPDWYEQCPQAHLHNVYNETRPRRDSLSADELRSALCTCGESAPKMRRLATPDEVRALMDDQIHDMAKRRISRNIFKSFRAARKAFRASWAAGEKFSSAPDLVFTPEKPPKPARIILVPLAFPATQPTGTDVYMGSVGSDLLTQEIKCLSSFCDDNGTYCIHDPEAGEDTDGDLLMEYSGSIYTPFRHDIRLTSGENHSTIVQGDPRALISLIEHLRREELYHLSRLRSVDIGSDSQGQRDVQMKVLGNDSIPFHLSHTVCSVLEKVQSRLEEELHLGGTEIRVGVVQQRAMFRVR